MSDKRKRRNDVYVPPKEPATDGLPSEELDRQHRLMDPTRTLRLDPSDQREPKPLSPDIWGLLADPEPRLKRRAMPQRTKLKQRPIRYRA